MAIPATVLGAVERIARNPVDASARRLADLLQMQLTAYATIAPPANQTTLAIMQEQAIQLPQMLAALPESAKGGVQWARVTEMLQAQNAVANPGLLARSSSFLPYVGVGLGVLVLVIGAVVRKRRKGKK